MADPLPLQAVGQSEETNDSEEEHVRENPPSQTRRRIYLERLMGDDFGTPRSQTTRAAPIHYTILFMIYLLIAVATIGLRGQVSILSSVNSSIMYSLSTRPYVQDPEPKTIHDITSLYEVPVWLENVVLQQLMTEDGGCSLATFNRLVPHPGVCLDTGSIMLTVRKVQPGTDYAKTTTDRFNQLYPSAWGVSQIRASSDPLADEDTRTLKGYYRFYDANTSINLYDVQDVEKMGYADGDLDIPVNPQYLPEGHEVYTSWKYTQPCSYNEGYEKCANDGGYLHNGGYVALIIPGQAGTNTSFTDAVRGYTSPNADVFVHLLDNEANSFIHETTGACDPGLKTTNQLGYAAFWQSGYVDENAGLVIFDWTLYNANYQTLSYVEVTFMGDQAGVILEKKGRSRVRVTTVYLDTDTAAPRYLMFVYFFLTVVYGCLLFLDSRKQNARKTWSPLKDKWFWINLVSIFSSLYSIIIWWTYEPGVGDFIRTDAFRIPSNVEAKISEFMDYSRASSMATLTICLRLVQCLSNTKARVRLLEKTLTMAMKNMIVYLLYVLIILLGFWAFAFIHFSAYSMEFAEPTVSLMTCFSMFLGDNSAIIAVKGAMLKNPFYLMFMLFFFFISVQMFNAIINYSYNLVCEEMEPHIERERAEHKRKAQRRNSMPSFYVRWFQKATQLVKLDKDAAKQDATADKANASGLSPKEQFRLEQEKGVKAPEGALSLLLFALFALCYFFFLYVNLDIEHNSKVKSAMKGAIFDGRVDMPNAVEPCSWDSIHDLHYLQSWVYKVLPLVIFEDSLEASSGGFYPPQVTCIADFQCLITAPEGEIEKMVRITRRNVNDIENVGSYYGSENEAYWFTGGTNASGVAISSLLMPSRRDLAGVEQDEGVIVPPSLESFCRSDDKDIECLLANNFDDFMNELDIMEEADFLDHTLDEVRIDFISYNPNRNIIIYALIKLKLLPSGLVEPTVQLSSYGLFDLKKPSVEIVFRRLLPGFLYMIFVFYFSTQLLRAFHLERKKKSNLRKKILTSLFEFFANDLFNLLELWSISISITSFVVFVIWVIAEFRLDGMVTNRTEFNTLIDYIHTLAQRQRLYNQLSAFNMLIIAVRPLKFFRRDARFAQLFKTFVDAREDITYFTLMLIITMFGFVLFAYVSFGPTVKSLGRVDKAFNYCFYYVLGVFDFWPLFDADSRMALIFFPVYLLLFYCVFTNIFFAIVDRFFNAAEPPPFNWKRQLKGTFGRVCTCFNWDEDYLMEEPAEGGRKKGPMSRRDRVKDIFVDMQKIRQTAHEHVSTDNQKNSLMLSEVCDVDERMADVLLWSKEEAKYLVNKYQNLYTEKLETRNLTAFVSERMLDVKADRAKAWLEMRDSERYKRYTIQVKERMQRRDQETLARYIDVLQNKIKEKMAEKKALSQDVFHLIGETQKMRWPKDEMTKMAQAEASAEAVGDEAGAPAIAGHEPEASPAARGAEDSESDSDSSLSNNAAPVTNGVTVVTAEQRQLERDAARNEMGAQLQGHLQA